MKWKLCLTVLLFNWISCLNNPAVLPALTHQQDKHVTPVFDSVALALASKYNHFFEQGMRQNNAIGAAVAVVKDSQVLLLKGYGLRETGTKDSISTQTVFRIGSLSKGFTGVLTGILVHQHKLDWRDKVVYWLPEFGLRDQLQGKRIEIRHLLSHTTGLPYHAYTNLLEAGYDLKTILTQYIPKSPICGKEGAFYAYQNVAFSLSGAVMLAATGNDFATLLKQNIFSPAQMSSASCTYNAIQMTNNKALPHQWTGSDWVVEPISEAYYNAAEAGGVNASINDMAQWLQVLLGNRSNIVSNAVLDTVFTPVVKTGNERRILGNWIHRDDASYAMGWRVLNHEGNTIIYHSGYVNGFRSEIAFDRKKRIGICVLFNGQTQLCGKSVPQFFDLYDQIINGTK